MFQNLPAQKIAAKCAIAFGLTLYCVAFTASLAADNKSTKAATTTSKSTKTDLSNSKSSNAKLDSSKSSNAKLDQSKSSNTKPDASKTSNAKADSSKSNIPKTDSSKSTTSADGSKVSSAKSTTSKTSEQLTNGERMFKRHYCVGCHSNGGNALMPDRPIKGDAFVAKYKDDTVLEKTIRKGFPEEGMPAFPKDQISESQMKDLILYIRSFSAQNK